MAHAHHHTNGLIEYVLSLASQLIRLVRHLTGVAATAARAAAHLLTTLGHKIGTLADRATDDDRPATGRFLDTAAPAMYSAWLTGGLALYLLTWSLYLVVIR
jgi:hypothetical protein